MWKALVLVVKSTTSLGRPYHPPGSAIYFDFSLSRCCITLFWGFLSNKNLVFTSCGTLFSLGVPQSHPKITFNSISEVQPTGIISKWEAILLDLFEPGFSWNFPRKIPFFLLPACWHNENHHLHGDFQVKRRNPMQFRCLHLTVNSQWNCEFRCIGVRIGG